MERRPQAGRSLPGEQQCRRKSRITSDPATIARGSGNLHRRRQSSECNPHAAGFPSQLPAPRTAAGHIWYRGITMLRFSGRGAAADFLPHLIRRGLPLLLLCGFVAPALAQNVSLTGGTYSQNFDTLSNTAGSTTNTALPQGWQLNETGGGARDNEQYAVDTGASTTGDTYSYGAAGSTERAFGGLRSGTLVPNIGACFTNNTGTTLSRLDIAYTGEEWRLGTAARTDSLNFQYSLDATSITTGTWVDVAALSFTTPDTATTGAKNGNAAADRTAITGAVTGLAIANGASFCIRWVDIDASGADDGLAIDDFSVTTTGSATPALAINDVSAAEGNSGTTAFTFGFGLSQPAGAGGVTIQYATANGTATAGSDYVAASGTVTIPQGATSATVTIDVLGDTATEPDETFFVNIVSATGANVSDGQGLGTILNDDVNVVPIHDIQGNGLLSPLNGGVVVTEGIVTALKFNNGFFLQAPDAEADADPNTSEGIFVFTSTAPPAAAAVGNRVRVTATVSEFTPTSNLNQLSITELVTPTVVSLSSGNPLPTPVVLTTADFGPGSTPGTAEKLEGMRVTMASGRVVAPTDGNITESSATASTTGVFNTVLDGVARPFREPGLDVLDLFPVPGGKTPPRFDHNPERIMVRSRGQIGATSLTPEVDAQIANMTGVLDYFSGTWALLPDAGSGTVTGGKTPTPVPDARHEDVTISSFNLERFFDEINDGNGAVTLTAAALDKRLTKASLAICGYLKTPDILGLVEVENLRVIGMLADRINSTCPSAPVYVPYLVQGNDVGGINVGFLVNTKLVGGVQRVEVLEVTQYGKTTVFNNPNGTTALLNDRPPLLLRAIVHQDNGATYPVTAIINHLRSLSGLDDTTAGTNGWPTEGDRVRNKRGQQAAFLADLVQSLQQANPNERIVLLGDFNAYQFSDGYVDVLGIVRGDEVPADQVITWLPSPITTPLVDGSLFTANPAERYSYTFDGNAQTLDHALLNEALVLNASDISVEHARIDADFSVLNYGVAGTPTRISDHDPVRVAITVAAFRSANLSVSASATPASLHVGGTATYTVSVDNAGPNDAASASIALVFNAVVSPVVTAPAGWTCAAATQTATSTTVTCTTPTLANGASAVFTADIVTGVDLANTDLVLNAAVASQTTDPANADNSATASVQVIAEADLSLTATSGGSVDVGGTATYTVTADNAGVDDAQFAGVALVFGGLVSPTVTAPAGWTCGAPVQDATTTTVTCTTAVFANGASATFTATVPADAALGGQSLSLAAAVTSQTTDPVKDNNTATATVDVRAIADLAVTANATVASVPTDGTAAYTVSVSNAGPNIADTATVTLTFDALVSPTVTPAGGWTCTAPTQAGGNTSVTCTTAPFAVGASGTFDASFPAVAALGSRTVVLTAEATSGTADTNTGNNTATAAVAIDASADLSASVTATSGGVQIGGTATYSVTVANAGPSAATAATATLTFDATVAPVVTAPAGWTCAAPVQAGGNTTVACSASGPVAAGASATFNASFPATAALAGRTVRLTATVASASPDNVAGNNSASATVAIANNSADLSVRMIGRSERAGVYLVGVHNAGPTSANAPVLTITGNLLLRNVSLVPAAGWTCTSASVGTGFRFTCTAGAAMPSGTDAFFGLALAGRGIKAVSVTSTVTSTTTDPNTANNTVTRAITGSALPDICEHRYCRR
jgi:hypothetical protein